MLFSACMLAGTASTEPQQLWQGLRTSHADLAAYPLDVCIATANNLPNAWPTTVLWLPTPPAADAAERAAEQQWRERLMAATMEGILTLRVLYGLRKHQQAALRECVCATLQTQKMQTDTLTAHVHSAGLRCRECVDPESERKLFTRLLQGRQ